MLFGNTSENPTIFLNEFANSQALTDSFNNVTYNKGFIDVFSELGNYLCQMEMTLFQVLNMILFPLITLLQVFLNIYY
jgi:hypothetical protein